jgi:hypothetical protein
LSGYAGPPPTVHLRRGESRRRYLEPGLEDGKTFVFWPATTTPAASPPRARPRLGQSAREVVQLNRGHRRQARGESAIANAAYTYAPNFADGSYKEGVIDEGPDHVTFEFYTPYVIGATPANDKTWGVYESGEPTGWSSRVRPTKGQRLHRPRHNLAPIRARQLQRREPREPELTTSKVTTNIDSASAPALRR